MDIAYWVKVNGKLLQQGGQVKTFKQLIEQLKTENQTAVVLKYHHPNPLNDRVIVITMGEEIFNSTRHELLAAMARKQNPIFEEILGIDLLYPEDRNTISLLSSKSPTPA